MMANRPSSDENMAVSSDTGAAQQTLKENSKEESDLRASQSSSKMEPPKKKTFKITSVTKSSQRGGSGDLTQDGDGDSIDDLDETVDSHTEDLSSEMYDCSKGTDLDGQEALTPEEATKEKPGRFKVVKIDTKEPFRRGRWLCYDYPDTPEKFETKLEDSAGTGSTGLTNSVHYVPGMDDPSKNPLLAGASGTMYTHPQTSAPSDSKSAPSKGPGEMGQPMQPAATQSGQSQFRASQAGPSIPNATYSNHVAQSMPVYSMASTLPYSNMGGQQVPSYTQGMVPGQSKGHSVPVPSGQTGQPLRATGSVPNLPQQQPGSQTKTSQSVAGNIPFPGSQQQEQVQQPVAPGSQATSIPANVHSQPASVSGPSPSPQPQIPGAMQRGEYMNSAPQGIGQQQPLPQKPAQPQQPPQPVQQTGAGYNLVSTGSGLAQQNHQPSLEVSVADNGTAVDSLSMSGSIAGLHSHMDGKDLLEDPVAGLGPGLEPLQIAVGGITNANPEDEITEEAGSSTVAIDNKIEQAMDLVKSHLMYAVREEVEVLKEQIKELMERLGQLEYENGVLRAAATPETLAMLAQSQPTQPPPPSSSS